MNQSQQIEQILRDQQRKLHEVAEYASVEVRINEYRDSRKSEIVFEVYTGKEFGVGATEAPNLHSAVNKHLAKIEEWKAANSPANLAATKRAEAEKLMKEAAEIESHAAPA